MIRIPVCFSCKHYNRKTESCPAYPEGIPDDVLIKMERDVEECKNGVKFVDNIERK